MRELTPRLHGMAQLLFRSLQAAHLTAWPELLLPLVPMCGALILAANGVPAAGASFALLITTLCLWGAAWCFNDLVNAQRNDRAHSLLLRGTLTHRPALMLLAILVSAALLIALLLGWRFSGLSAVVLLVAFTYPWLRRKTYLIEAWFAVGIAWTVPLAYAALGRWPDKVGALLGVVTLLWAMGWLVLRQWPHHLELLERGARTLGLMFGHGTGHLVMALQLAVLLGGWMAGGQGKFGAPFSWMLLVSAAAMAWQSWLMHKHGSQVVPRALQLHLLSGVAIWLGVVLHFATA